MTSPFALTVTSLDKCGSKLPNHLQSGEASGFALYGELRSLMWSFVFIPGKQRCGFGWAWNSDSCSQQSVLLYRNLSV